MTAGGRVSALATPDYRQRAHVVEDEQPCAGCAQRRAELADAMAQGAQLVAMREQLAHQAGQLDQLVAGVRATYEVVNGLAALVNGALALAGDHSNPVVRMVLGRLAPK